MHIYLQLFTTFFQIGLFSIGGGYAALPIIESLVVEQHQWLNTSEWLDLIAIAEMTPGPIAINSATFVGTKIAGPIGAIIATLGNVMPCFIIVLSLAYLYNKYKNFTVMQRILSTLRPAVVALIASAAINILIMSLTDVHSMAPVLFNKINVFSVILFAGAFVTIRKMNINPILLMLGTGGVGLILHGAYSLL